MTEYIYENITESPDLKIMDETSTICVSGIICDICNASLDPPAFVRWDEDTGEVTINYVSPLSSADEDTLDTIMEAY